MTKRTHGLGRGLDSLFSEPEETGESIREIPVGELDPNPDQPRRTFGRESLEQLAASIREQGVLQPLLVAPAAGGRYRIIAGERRYRAGRMADLETLPCIVRDIDAIRQMEVALIENLQREDLNPLEEARGIDALMQQCGYTQEEVSERLGKSRPAVANTLRLLDLPEEVQAMIREGKLTSGHGRALAGMKKEQSRLAVSIAEHAAREQLSVREVERLVAEAKDQPEKPAGKAPARPLPAELEELREKMLRVTGMKSTWTGNIQKGKIVLQYSSREELEHLNELLSRLGDA